jgi:transposase
MEISRHNELLAAFAQMQCRLLALTDDVATLKAENATLKAELAARDASLLTLQLAHTQLETVVALQDEHIASLTKELFGKSSEKAKSPPLPPAIPKVKKGRHEHGRKPIPDHLPRVEEIHDVPPEIRPGMVQIGANRREILAWAPGYWYVRVIITPVYALPGEPKAGIVTAEVPELGIDRTKYDVTVAARLAAGKFVQHLPVYRQVQQFKREGVTIPNQSAVGQLALAADILKNLYVLLLALIRKRPTAHFDDTGVNKLDPGRGKVVRSFLWVIKSITDGPPLVAFIPTPGRGSADARTALGDFVGHLHADACPSHDQIFVAPEIGPAKVTEGGCMAHSRRKFNDAQAVAGKKLADAAIATIQKLYVIEAGCRPALLAATAKAKAQSEWDAAYDVRKQYRLDKGANALIDQLYATVDLILKDAIPGSKIYQAAKYTDNLRTQLRSYLDNGRYEIDNNTAENAIRPVALGRANWLFFGSDNGALSGAIHMTFAAMCKLHDIDLYEYYCDVLPRIQTYPASRVHDLLPHNWRATVVARAAAAS